MQWKHPSSTWPKKSESQHLGEDHDNCNLHINGALILEFKDADMINEQ
jgi:hypothetical protein